MKTSQVRDQVWAGFEQRVAKLHNLAQKLHEDSLALLRHYQLPPNMELNGELGFTLVMNSRYGKEREGNEHPRTEPNKTRRKKSSPGKVGRPPKKGTSLLSVKTIAERVIPIIKTLGQNGREFTNEDVFDALLQDGMTRSQIDTSRLSLATGTFLDGLTVVSKESNSAGHRVNHFVVSGDLRVITYKEAKAKRGTLSTPEKKASVDQRVRPGAYDDVIIATVAAEPGLTKEQLRDLFKSHKSLPKKALNRLGLILTRLTRTGEQLFLDNDLYYARLT